MYIMLHPDLSAPFYARPFPMFLGRCLSALSGSFLLSTPCVMILIGLRPSHALHILGPGSGSSSTAFARPTCGGSQAERAISASSAFASAGTLRGGGGGGCVPGSGGWLLLGIASLTRQSECGSRCVVGSGPGHSRRRCQVTAGGYSGMTQQLVPNHIPTQNIYI